jgi:dTDP-4-amino-4,6-dideoxygalactose transaminase
MKKIANHGQSVRYYHDIVGCNSRLDTIQAAVLNIKLPLLDNYIRARQKVAAYYNEVFAGDPRITTPVTAPYSTHVFHQFTLKLEGVDRNALNQYLAEEKVPSMIYYPVPAHRQKMFEGMTANQVELPVTDWLTERVISLPMHTELDNEQLEYISTSVLNFMRR